MSGLTVISYESIKRTVDVLKERGLRDKVKIMIGGGAVDPDWAQRLQVESAGLDASEAVKVCKTWAKEAS